MLERIPDLSAIPKLQIDGVPEQLADWELEQRKKRAEDAKSGNNKGAAKQEKTSGWQAIKKGHAMVGTAASQHGRAMTREELEARNNPGKAASTSTGGATARQKEGDGAGEPLPEAAAGGD